DAHSCQPVTRLALMVARDRDSCVDLGEPIPRCPSEGESAAPTGHHSLKLARSPKLFSGISFFSSRRRHTRFSRDWSSDVCSSDLIVINLVEDDLSITSTNFLIVSSMNMLSLARFSSIRRSTSSSKFVFGSLILSGPRTDRKSVV